MGSSSSSDETYEPPSSRKSHHSFHHAGLRTADRVRRRRLHTLRPRPFPTTSTTTSEESTSTPIERAMTREEKKLEQVLKLIEKMEGSQKRKQTRITQKKEKDKKPDEVENILMTQATPGQTTSQTRPNHLMKVTSPKWRGKKRGHSGSSAKGSAKPQMITQRNSGSAGDLRSPSVESDSELNSADEAGVGMLPGGEIENNFRFPQVKKVPPGDEWSPDQYGSHYSPSETNLASQYIRKSAASASASSASSLNQVPGVLTPANNMPAGNTANLESGSIRKRWLRQAISEETDPLQLNSFNHPSPNSRPNTPPCPGATDCLAPMKKRILTRVSMFSEVSNTPPSTPVHFQSETESGYHHESLRDDEGTWHMADIEENTHVESKSTPPRREEEHTGMVEDELLHNPDEEQQNEKNENKVVQVAKVSKDLITEDMEVENFSEELTPEPTTIINSPTKRGKNWWDKERIEASNVIGRDEVRVVEEKNNLTTTFVEPTSLLSQHGRMTSSEIVSLIESVLESCGYLVTPSQNDHLELISEQRVIPVRLTQSDLPSCSTDMLSGDDLESQTLAKWKKSLLEYRRRQEGSARSRDQEGPNSLPSNIGNKRMKSTPLSGLESRLKSCFSNNRPKIPNASKVQDELVVKAKESYLPLWSSTSTTVEKSQEEMRPRLNPLISLSGINFRKDCRTAAVEAPTTASLKSPISTTIQIENPRNKTNNFTWPPKQSGASLNPPELAGHRLSVPTAAARKQYPPQLTMSNHVTPMNGPKENPSPVKINASPVTYSTPIPTSGMNGHGNHGPERERYHHYNTNERHRGGSGNIIPSSPVQQNSQQYWYTGNSNPPPPPLVDYSGIRASAPGGTQIICGIPLSNIIPPPPLTPAPGAPVSGPSAQWSPNKNRCFQKTGSGYYPKQYQ